MAQAKPEIGMQVPSFGKSFQTPVTQLSVTLILVVSSIDFSSY